MRQSHDSTKPFTIKQVPPAQLKRKKKFKSVNTIQTFESSEVIQVLLTCKVSCSLGLRNEQVMFLIFEGTPHRRTRQDFIYLQQLNA